MYPLMGLGGALWEAVVLAYVALVLHLPAQKYFWVGLLAGELGRAWAGAWWVRRKQGYPLTADQRARVALAYTLAVTGPPLVFLPLVLSRAPRLAPLFADRPWLLHPHGAVQAAGALLVVAAVIAVASLLRYLLLTLFNPRR
jgi:hypothetical protein